MSPRRRWSAPSAARAPRTRPPCSDCNSTRTSSHRSTRGTASIAALQARAMVDSGRFSETDFASVVSARRGGVDVEQLLRQPYVASPLRSLDGSTICSGAAAVVLAIEEVATGTARRPAWIAGIHHLIERHSLGARDLSSSPSRPSLVRSVASERAARRCPGSPCSLQPSGAPRRGVRGSRRGGEPESLGGSPSG